MSTSAIDTARSDERLSAFLSEIGTNEPVDNFFVKRPVLDRLMKDRQTTDGGRQIIYPIDSGQNPTIRDFADYDLFDTTAPNTALTVVYPMVNKGGSIVISWEEQRETAGSDHKIFDLIAHRRRNAMKTIMDAYASDVFAAAQDPLKITALPLAILATGSVGGLSQATDADWAATVTASGSFAAQGLNNMRTLYNTLSNNGQSPDTIVMTQAIYEFYEAEVDPDVRYAMAQGVGGRGFKTLEFKGIPLIHDLKATSGVIYMWNSENLFMIMDSEGNFATDDFQTPTNQKASIAKIYARGNLVLNRRKSTGKLTGVVA